MYRSTTHSSAPLAAGLVLVPVLSLGLAGSSAHAVETTALAQLAPAPVAAVPAVSAVDQEAHEWHARRAEYVRRTWGVDVDSVRAVSSGFMLEFRYTVVDPHKAEALQIKTVKPFVIDESTSVRLSVPAMENVGELRQTAAPEAGRSYYIIFGNPGHLVKRGGHVTVVIGEFRVSGLVVQ
jgi:hypothetical protein